MPDKLHRFAWCEWTKWIEECRANPNHIVVATIPPNLDENYFRITASQRAKEQGAKAHVTFERHKVVRLQFCWRTDNHRRLHVDGAALTNIWQILYWAPGPYIAKD